MRAIWKGAVSFGLVNVPVRLFAATQEHDIRFHQVHREDGGRIRMKRTCSIDGEEVPYDQIAKGYESPDGRLVVLQTLLWPDEVRAADFEILDQDVDLRPQELTMAQSLVESLAADFDPDAFEDEYAKALSDMVEAKLEGAPPIPTAEVDAGA